eukprot:COSAG01_NODE_5623_length_4141_cov_11.376051_2_plen_42_part_00
MLSAEYGWSDKSDDDEEEEMSPLAMADDSLLPLNSIGSSHS